MKFEDRKDRLNKHKTSRDHASAEKKSQFTKHFKEEIKKFAYETARTELGFNNSEDAYPALQVNAETFSIEQKVHLPEKINTDDTTRSALFTVGGPIDIFDDDYERKRKLYYNSKLFKNLQRFSLKIKRLGDFFDKDCDIKTIRNSFHPKKATIETNFKGNLVLVLRGNGKTIEVSTGDIPKLIYLTLKNGKEWIYDEISRIEAIDTLKTNREEDDEKGS